MFKKLLIFFALSVYIIVLITPAENAVLVTKRQIEDDEDSEEDLKRICETYQTPCGWAIYKPFKRKIEYFMRNACKCTPGLKCIRTDDDAQVSAFVYKCRNRTSTVTETTTIIPTTISPQIS